MKQETGTARCWNPGPSGPGGCQKSRCKVACDCTLLDENGRCSDYENRPAVCRNYEPASDQLCCEWKGERKPSIPEEFLVYPKDSK